MIFRHALQNSILSCPRRFNRARFLATNVVPNARISRADQSSHTQVAQNFKRSSLKVRSRTSSDLPHPRKKPPENESSKRLLRPYVLSSRLKKLCDDGQHDAAIDMLKSSALGAQNTPVWNTLIWECMKAKRFKSAYKLFIDMKRRGFSPTTRTFQTMFSGLSRIEDWHSHPKQLANAHSVYDYFQRHLGSLKKYDPHSPDLTVTPIASYIKILGDAEDYQRIFDVYYAMDQHAALSPNEFIFTAMFRALSERRTPTLEGHPTIHIQNASDAKLLWRQMLKASERTPGLPIDSHIVSPAIIALSRGQTADQIFALDIVREYLGLTKPRDIPSPGKIPLSPQTLAAALSLCNHMRDFRLCLHFFRLVRDRPEKFSGLSVFDRGHVEEVLKAYAAMTTLGSREEPYHALQTLEWMLEQEMTGPNGPKIRPAISTYNLVLLACWRGGDWASAIRTFEIMTGYSARDFEDGRDSSINPDVQKRSRGRNLVPDVETMSCMVQTALATRNPAYLRQSLRMVNCVGIDHLLGPSPRSKARKEISKKVAKYATFHQIKLAGAITEALSQVSSGHAKSDDAVWQVLKSRARDVLSESTKESPIPAKGHHIS